MREKRGEVVEDRKYAISIIHCGCLNSPMRPLQVLRDMVKPRWHKVKFMKWNISSDLSNISGDLLTRSYEVVQKIPSNYVCQNICSDLQLFDEQLKNYALAELQKLLERNGSSLQLYSSIPQLDNTLLGESNNIMIQEELQYDNQEMSSKHMQLLSIITTNNIKGIMSL
ncbi:hypothetical protein V2J09_015825 [Rumex salicifolius]